MNPSFSDRISFRYILILFSHLYLGLENGVCASRSPLKRLYAFPISHMLAACPDRHIQTDFIIKQFLQ